MQIAKVDDLYLNVERVSMARDHRCPETNALTGDLLVYFHKDKRARLKGAEADGVRQILLSHVIRFSSDPNGQPTVSIAEGSDDLDDSPAV